MLELRKVTIHGTRKAHICHPCDLCTPIVPVG
jgi:hypothetical protein